jgi:hypothetical protein
MPFGQIIYNAAIADGMPSLLASFIVAQSKHETNDYTSAIFKDCNNAFGYKSVRSSCLVHPGYQDYISVVDSAHEITGWIKRRLNQGDFPALNTITTPEQYAALLKENGYYEDNLANYTAGLLRWFDSNTVGVAGLGLVFVALAVYFFLHKKKP